MSYITLTAIQSLILPCNCSGINYFIVIAIIFEYHKDARWSSEYKGKGIELFEDESKAMCIHDRKEGCSVRADFYIKRGDIVCWELECMIIASGFNFIGVVTYKIRFA